MSIPPRLARRFNDVLGADAAGDLVNWMDEMRADHAETRQELRAVRAEIAGLAKSMHDRFERQDGMFARQDARFEKQDARFEKQDARFAKQDERFEQLIIAISTVSQRLEYLRGNFIAWNAAFWLTAVSAIVGLLQFLGR